MNAERNPAGTLRRPAMLAALILALPCALPALEWPVAEPEIRRNFGQEENGNLERGLILSGGNTVRAAGDGSVLTVLSCNENMNGFPSTLGNAVLLAHGDGIVSVYGNLADTEMAAGKEQMETYAVIAQTGGSAWGGLSGGGEDRGICIFQIADQNQKTLLNPLLLLPPQEDNRAPVIQSVTLESASGQTLNLSTSRFLRSGVYRVYAAVTDTRARNSPALAPFRVSVLVNGSEQSAVAFETLEKKASVLAPAVFPDYFDGSTPLYNRSGLLYAGNVSLTRGRTEITVAARDFTGNERTSAFLLQIE